MVSEARTTSPNASAKGMRTMQTTKESASPAHGSVKSDSSDAGSLQSPRQERLVAPKQRQSRPRQRSIPFNKYANEDGGTGGPGDESDEGDYSSVSTEDDLPLIRAYGHTYHGTGTILVPNDESERARLEIQHTLFKLCLDGALTQATLPQASALGGRPLTILDIGSGTGAWAIEMAERYPEARIRGIDISTALLPKAVPSNVIFEVQDANEPWAGAAIDGGKGGEGPGTTEEGGRGGGGEGARRSLELDFVHVRNLVGGGVRDWKRLFRQAFEHLRPGGQVEVAEVRPRWFSFEDSGDEEDLGRPLKKKQGPQGTSSHPGAGSTDIRAEGSVADGLEGMQACRQFEVNMASMTERLGVDFDPMPKMGSMLTDVGFERMIEMSDLVPMRAYGTDEKMRQKGAQLSQLIEYGLENYSLAIFGKCGWDEDDTRSLMKRIREEIQDPGVQVFGKVTFITARKPAKS